MRSRPNLSAAWIGLLAVFSLLFLPASTLAFELADVYIHGFVSQGYLFSDENDYFFAETDEGTFQFNEVGINLTANPMDRLRISLQLLSRDLGRFGNNDVELDYAFGDWRQNNWLGVRAGRMKMAQGLYNQVRDVDAARPMVFLPPVYNEVFRESQKSITGAGLYGTLPAGFSYQLQFGKIDLPDDGATAQVFAQGINAPAGSVEIETEDDTYVLFLEWNPPVAGLRFVGSYLGNLAWDAQSPLVSTQTETKTWVLSAEYQWNGLTLAAEYLENSVESESAGQIIQDFTRQTYYGMASYRWNNWLETGAYYAESYNNKDDKEGDAYAARGQLREFAWLKDTALFARFDISSNWIVKVEGHYLDGLKDVVDFGTPDPEGEGFLMAIKTTFIF